MASRVVEVCEEKIVPIINKLGYDVIEVEYAKKSDGMNLSFYIDKPDGILIEDCEKVHKTIDPVLDELNITNDVSYILNVCSPGLDRPIKNEKDFIRNKNKLVNVSLFSPLNGKKNYTGNLTDWQKDFITLTIDNQEVQIEHKKIGQISPVIQF